MAAPEIRLPSSTSGATSSWGPGGGGVRTTVQNPPTGGYGGQDWGDSMWRYQRVYRIEAWYGQAWQIPYIVLKGIKITWDDGSTQERGTIGNDLQYEEHTFGQFEDVKEMAIRGAPSTTAGRADSLQFYTNWGGQFFAGGPGGDAHRQDVGNGTLIGFVGASQGDIDRLGAVFFR
ncbi:hypothetical protein BBP40_000569 [Aspergillus hancockii]|nr:hypothetical protein BBP40_000569 [Aspergillus hancockii]